MGNCLDYRDRCDDILAGSEAEISDTTPLGVLTAEEISLAYRAAARGVKFPGRFAFETVDLIRFPTYTASS